ncbi:ABC transporter permease [Erysipelotrichaceae bacterium OttesenSCG-928-M19]|nr:ABC transporter permease [Erysipelotrichaceae bacterium OttesenSCG-928-M19]
MLTFFKYRFKSLISEKSLMFWSLLFPIILVSFFYLVFSNIGKENIFDTFNVAIVGNKENQLIKTMDEVKYDDIKTFELQYLTKEDSLNLLNQKKIAGIVEIKNNDEYELIINDNGSKQLILEEFLSNYQQKELLINDVLKNNPELLTTNWLETLTFSKDNVSNKSLSEKSNNEMIISFYTVIALSCFMSSFISANGISTIQANISKQGARLSVSPYHKRKIIIIDFIASLLIIISSVITLLIYMNFILKIEFGNHLGPILIICFVGSLVSTAFGYFLSLLFKKKEGLTIAMIIAMTMSWSFLAGMMGPSIKYIIESNLPFMKYLNPVALITDSFYTLYYYDSFAMCLPYLGALIVMFIVFITGAIMFLRGDQYDSI